MYEEIFKSAMLGFNKEEVQVYIDNLVSDHQRIVKIKEEEIVKLQKRIGDMELRMARLKGVEEEYLALQKTMTDITEERKQKDKKIQTLSLQLDELRDSLTVEVPKAEQPVKEVIKEVVVERPSKESEELSKKITVLNRELRSLLDKNNELTNDNEQLSKELKAINSLADDYIAKIEELNSQIKDSDAKYKADLDERLVQLTSENEKLKSEIAEFEAIDRDVEKEKMKIAQAVLRAQEKAESMEIEMRYKFDAENTRLENYKKEIDELRDKAMVILSKFEGELGEFIEENISKKGVAKIAK